MLLSVVPIQWDCWCRTHDGAVRRNQLARVGCPVERDPDLPNEEPSVCLNRSNDRGELGSGLIANPPFRFCIPGELFSGTHDVKPFFRNTSKENQLFSFAGRVKDIFVIYCLQVLNGPNRVGPMGRCARGETAL